MPTTHHIFFFFCKPWKMQQITFGLIRTSTFLFIIIIIFYFPKASISQSLIYTTPLKKSLHQINLLLLHIFSFFRLLNLRFFRHSNFSVHTFSFFNLFLVFLNQFTQHLDGVEVGKQDRERKRRRLRRKVLDK